MKGKIETFINMESGNIVRVIYDLLPASQQAKLKPVDPVKLPETIKETIREVKKRRRNGND